MFLCAIFNTVDGVRLKTTTPLSYLYHDRHVSHRITSNLALSP